MALMIPFVKLLENVLGTTGFPLNYDPVVWMKSAASGALGSDFE